MPISPWKSFSKPEQDKEYVVQATYLPLRRFWSLIKFFRLTRAVQNQLNRDSPGLVGYSTNAKILRHEFWTLSVWQDRTSIANFVAKMPHSKAMKDLKNDMGETKFRVWTAKGSSIPPSWEDALIRLA